MIQLFKKQKSEKEIIEEIHNEFDTAPDRLLQRAMQIIEQESNQKVVLESSIEDKAQRLEKLGFVKNGLVARKKEIQQRNNEKDKVIALTSQQAKLLKHYKDNYPFIKTLTIDELDRICDKYGLIYAPVNHYKYPVPDKNLEDIENVKQLNFTDKPQTEFSVKYRIYDWSNYRNKYVVPSDAKKWDNPITIKTERTEISERHLINELNERFNKTGKDISFSGSLEITKIQREGLFIAAPKKHFDLEGLEFDKKKGYFTVTKTVVKTDPIVFRYVAGDMVQVLTKWGLEANDPALQVEILN